LTAQANTRTPVVMNIPEPVTTIEHRCEALTISEIPPYRCTTPATGARQGREVCTSHACSLHVHWFDGDDAGMTAAPPLDDYGVKANPRHSL
jgi:hypothetical protein